MRACKIDGILVLYAHPYSANAPTIMEHVNAFKKYSKYKVWTINTNFGFVKNLPEFSFKIIVLHYSLFGASPFNLKGKFYQYVKNAKSSFRIAFFQDEYQFCGERFALLNELSIDFVYSLLESRYFEEVYYKNTTVKQVFQTLTGYVDDEMIKKTEYLTKPLENRVIDVGYRARQLPYYMGKGAQEKTEIAKKFVNHSKSTGLSLDIDTDNRKRIYGDNWYRFIANCRAMIGVEAGVSVFDIADKVRPAIQTLISQKPKITFEEAYREVLIEWEDKIYYRQSSPRLFEAAALHVLLILFEGKYSGLIEPMVHYVPLKKDFSNINDVLGILSDPIKVNKITQNAYTELITSRKYDYRNFIANFDTRLCEIMNGRDAITDDSKNVDKALKSGYFVRMMIVKIMHKKNNNFVRRILVKIYYWLNEILRNKS
jgi:hypothetical protein